MEIKKVSPNQSSFELISPDNKKTTVNLKMPLRDTLSEIVEVYGSVDDRGNINCINYTTFDTNATQNFGWAFFFKLNHNFSVINCMLIFFY